MSRPTRSFCIALCLLATLAAPVSARDLNDGVPIPTNDVAVNELIVEIVLASSKGDIEGHKRLSEQLQMRGTGALPGLLFLIIKSPDPRHRCVAATSISHLEGQARGCTPILIDAFSKEKDDLVRLTLIRGAKRINDNDVADYGWAKPHVKLLIRALRDKEPMVGDDAALILRGLGTDARAAVPELIAVLGDDKMHYNIRYIIPSALTAIAPESAEVRTALEAAPKNERLNEEAGKALQEIARLRK